jgi:thymidylate synthase (FAD)
MRLIKPYYEIESEIDGEKILRHIEKAARTCYKSEDKINDFEKTKKFVKGRIHSIDKIEIYEVSSVEVLF